MVKWLLVIGVVWAVYYFFIKQKPQTTTQNKTQNKNSDVEDMVECAKCGVYVEIKEAILSNGKYYCSDKCLKG
jgi:uncharacterized protein